MLYICRRGHPRDARPAVQGHLWHILLERRHGEGIQYHARPAATRGEHLLSAREGGGPVPGVRSPDSRLHFVSGVSSRNNECQGDVFCLSVQMPYVPAAVANCLCFAIFAVTAMNLLTKIMIYAWEFHSFFCGCIDSLVSIPLRGCLFSKVVEP